LSSIPLISPWFRWQASGKLEVVLRAIVETERAGTDGPKTDQLGDPLALIVIGTAGHSFVFSALRRSAFEPVFK